MHYLIESFALYGAAMSSAAPFAVNSARAEEQTPRDICPAKRQVFASLISLRERERKITAAIAALAALDDRTLLDMGISDRSQIELVVRYCHDC